MLAHPRLGSFIDALDVKGRVVTFTATQGSSGRIEATDGSVVFDAQLSGTIAFMKPMIESKIEEVLDRLFPD